MQEDYNDFKDVYDRNLVFWKDKKVHLTETGQPICTNFGRGGMKKVFEDMMPKVSLAKASTCGMRVYANGDESTENLWPRALKMAKMAKVACKELR